MSKENKFKWLPKGDGWDVLVVDRNKLNFAESFSLLRHEDEKRYRRNQERILQTQTFYTKVVAFGGLGLLLIGFYKVTMEINDKIAYWGFNIFFLICIILVILILISIFEDSYIKSFFKKRKLF